jgi:acrylyl-CoA reductase (NADPH)
MFKALLLEKTETASHPSITELDEARLPEGDVLLQVDYSTLNYKDALAITHRGPVVRQWPMVPGIDGAGTVLQSSHPAWKRGDRVVHNGWGLGETRWGCLAGKVRLSGDGLVPLPEAFTPRQAMAIGTAGYTAMLSVLALERHRHAADAAGKAAERGYLQQLGAHAVIDRAELAAPGKPLQKERWAAVVDAVGSHTLVNALAQTRYGGVVTACGLAQGADLPGTVMPFILRGVTLAGIDSVMAPLSTRRTAWQRLARDLDPALLELMTREITLDEAIAGAHDLLGGKLRGRVVVRIA